MTPERSTFVRHQPNESARQIREFHYQLDLFNGEIVPRFGDGRSDVPAYRPCRVRRFVALSTYLGSKLDERTVRAVVDHPADHLRHHLGQLHVCTRLVCSCFDDSFQQHPGMAFLRDEDGMPGHAFASVAWGLSPRRITDCAEKICMWLEHPTCGPESYDVIRSASCSELEACLAVMDIDEYFDLVEAQFSIRHETPVSLQLRDLKHGQCMRGIMSTIRGNLMGRLANNYFHQTLAIPRLPECEGSWHGFIAGQVFDIVMQKWLRLMGRPRSDEAIELEEAGNLSLAIQRGVVESMLNASKGKR